MAKDNVAEDLRAELKTLADTLEEVLNSSTDKSKEEIGKLRSKAESALKESRVRLGETSDALLKQTRETAVRRVRPDEPVSPHHLGRRCAISVKRDDRHHRDSAAGGAHWRDLDVTQSASFDVPAPDAPGAG